MSDSNSYPTDTSIDQIETMKSIYNEKLNLNLVLHKSIHISYLLRPLKDCLSSGFTCLDASRPWILYWILHSLDLLDYPIHKDEKLVANIIQTIASFQDWEFGGFGGGPGQVSHLAPTYASVSALMILGTREAYEIIHIPKLKTWIQSLKQPDGSFRMHTDGEIDLRASYCAMAVCTLLNIESMELIENVGEYISSCQTYQGGLGGTPGSEAHGGYTYCGVAVLALINKMECIRIDSLLDWLVHRQMEFEGGFQGRTNKLVDGCYSFWQASVFSILEMCVSDQIKGALYNRIKLQEYILSCCQDQVGGLRDKPGKRPDFYHTCYCLSGLSISQHGLPLLEESMENDSTGVVVLGPQDNLLNPTHPLYNIQWKHVKNASHSSQRHVQSP